MSTDVFTHQHTLDFWLVTGYIIGVRGGCALTINNNNGQTMTKINYNMMHKTSLNGECLMDRTIDIPAGIGECVGGEQEQRYGPPDD